MTGTLNVCIYCMFNLVHKRLEYLPVIIGHATVTVDVNVELKGSTKI